MWRVKYQWNSARWHQPTYQPTNESTKLSAVDIWFGSPSLTLVTSFRRLPLNTLLLSSKSLTVCSFNACECAATKVQENEKKKKKRIENFPFLNCRILRVHRWRKNIIQHEKRQLCTANHFNENYSFALRFRRVANFSLNWNLNWEHHCDSRRMVFAVFSGCSVQRCFNLRCS